MHELFKEFTFDAAHHLGSNVEPGHHYGRVHGHSFTVTVVLRGDPDPKTQWIADLSKFKDVLDKVHFEIDHHYLNDIAGLETPTMESISRWIYQQVKPEFPQLHRVTVRGGTLGEGCTYSETP